MLLDLKKLEKDFNSAPNLLESIETELLRLEQPIKTEQDLYHVFHLSTLGMYRDPSDAHISTYASEETLILPQISLKDCVVGLKAAKRAQINEDVIYV